MEPQDVFFMTAKGLEEVREKKGGLPPEARFVFFMIDGRTAAGNILTVLSGVGVTPEVFDLLARDGYIAKAAPAPAAAPPAPAPASRPAEHREAAASAVPRPLPQDLPVESRAPNAGALANDDDRFFLARQYMNETVVHAVGLRSFLFTLKLERAISFQDLRKLLDDYARLIRKGSGTLESDVLIRRARELTS